MECYLLSTGVLGSPVQMRGRGWSEPLRRALGKADPAPRQPKPL